MPLHFSREEFSQRVTAAHNALNSQNLDGILLFAPESHYYLSGYDTFGFAMFQCMILCTGEDPVLLTRAPDRLQALQTSTLPEHKIHIWSDNAGADPVGSLVELLGSTGLLGKKIGIETQTPGLTMWQGKLLEQQLAGKVTLVEASDLVPSLRRVKSHAEIAYTRKAARLSDLSLDAGLQASHSGGFEGDILAAMQGEVFKGGGDYAGNEFIIGSGPGALLCRYHSGRRHLDTTDQMTLEWSGAYRRYHAAMMRTIIIGKANDKQTRMHAAAVEALEACEQAIKPGQPMGTVFDAHARVFDAHGFAHARMNACGYGMGVSYNPIWVEFPMFFKDNPLIMEAGNVFFLHMILMDSASGFAMCWGHSVLVTDTGIERLSNQPLQLIEQ